MKLHSDKFPFSGLMFFIPVILLLLFFSQDVFADTTNVMIVLDASGSMGEKIEGQTKLDIAKKVIHDVLLTLPPDVRVGLRVYGHQSPKFLKDCYDSRLEVPLGFHDASQIEKVLVPIQPRGYTPLAYTLDAIKNDFIYNGKNVIICMTDGVETCDGDPCLIADNLRRLDISVKIHMIGFDVGEIDQEILMCVPKNSGGQYFSANNSVQLENALQDAFKMSINPGYLILEFKNLKLGGGVIFGKLFTEDNEFLFSQARTDQKIALPPGVFKIRDFYIWSPSDPNPYNDSNVSIDSVRVVSGNETVVPLDEYAIIDAEIIFPMDFPQETKVIINDLTRAKIHDEIIINAVEKKFLLRSGEYKISASLVSEPDRIIAKQYVFLPQSYNEIIIDLKPFDYTPFIFGGGIGLFVLFLLLWMRKSRQDPHKVIIEFAKNPQSFRGKIVELELRLSPEDKACGHAVSFWTYFPVDLGVQIYVPAKFFKIKSFDTSYKILVKFMCQSGDHLKGNVLISYKRGTKIK